jgi:glycosyltransferase involved in cell wall biosynthesis
MCPDVTVIIPTLAKTERAPLIWRAIESVISQNGIHAIPLVVVNGQTHDIELVRQLRAHERVRLIAVDLADLPNALRAGRSEVTTPWFATLDDDDLLLPNAIAARYEVLTASPALDVVITSGYICDVHGERLHPPSMSAIYRDPIASLGAGNWLLPGSWLARSASVGPELFDGMPRYLECTFLAIQFCLRYRAAFLDQPTVRWHAATKDGDHLESSALLAQPRAIESLLRLDPPPGLQKTLVRRLSAAHHACANYHLGRGDLANAWREHVESLSRPSGLRYWPVSLKILREFVRAK